jgi:hypothetical protein
MLIGIQLSDLSRRSRWLLLLATLTFAAGLAMLALAPEPAARLLQVWLAAVVALGLYWVSFLLDFRGRLQGGQLVVASLFALLPWILVIVLVVGFPQVLLGSAGGA